MTKSSYESVGASATKAGLHDQLEKAGVETSSGLFASVTADFAGDPDYYSFVHCDGAGTKSIVSYLLYKATGDTEAFAGLAQDALVMNLDDVYCIGAPQSLVLANAIARNARLVPDDAVGALIRRYRELVEQLAALNVPIELSGGETADCGDVVRTLIVDAVVSGRIKRDQVVDANRIVPGDVIIGLSSCGSTSYDPEPNSGIGSNGLTLARHCLLSKAAMEKYPEVVDPGLDQSAAYRGPYLVTDEPEGLGMSVGKALSSPTRTYAPVLAKIYAELGNAIHGAIHATGGGLTKVLRFGNGCRYIKDDLFDTPPLFTLIQEHGEVEWKEMYQVFNMGQRMELYLPEKNVSAVLACAKSLGVDAKVIGKVEKASGQVNSVVVDSANGTFEYQL